MMARRSRARKQAALQSAEAAVIATTPLEG
jgi:hypothetical protein